MTVASDASGGEISADVDMRACALQRQLANDEPKCGNCRLWDAVPRLPMFGHCRFGFLVSVQVAVLNEKRENGSELEDEFEPPLTTDLSVCSKWEKKP